MDAKMVKELYRQAVEVRDIVVCELLDQLDRDEIGDPADSPLSTAKSHIDEMVETLRKEI